MNKSASYLICGILIGAFFSISGVSTCLREQAGGDGQKMVLKLGLAVMCPRM
jgi:hypothetical protein